MEKLSIISIIIKPKEENVTTVEYKYVFTKEELHKFLKEYDKYWEHISAAAFLKLKLK